MRSRPSFTLFAALLAVAAMASSTSFAQRRGGFGFRNGACQTSWDKENYFVSPFFRGNTPYDGRVTFARVKYQGAYECGREGPGWAHDYPRTETHFMRILDQLTSMRAFVEQGEITGGVLVRLDRPEIFRYPVAYLSEPGGWQLTDAEQKGLQQYIEKGRFMIIDDIDGDPNPDYRNLVEQWHRAFPGSVPVKLTNHHKIFNSFFRIDLAKIPSKNRRFEPEYLAFFEDNDPNKRMVAVIDNHADIGEFIEFSDEGRDMIPANEAYKLWVNYCVYALSH